VLRAFSDRVDPPHPAPARARLRLAKPSQPSPPESGGEGRVRGAASKEALRPLMRHELLWITPEAWAEALRPQSGLAGEPCVRGWAKRGWPVIVRRRFENESPDHVPVGLPLPPSLGKRRIALSVSWEGVADRKALVPLRCALPTAPPTWRLSLSRILALGKQVAVEPAVFGSLLWQHLTGLDYLTPTSDLDLLWPVPAGFCLRPLLEGLAAGERPVPRLDGEIVLPGGVGINWRELRQSVAAAEGQVLAKSLDGTRLVPTRAIVEPAVAA
jgi:phosphoribosyl-dephospho-CoA transferase